MNLGNRLVFEIRRNSPEILMGLGYLGFAVALYFTAKESMTFAPVLEGVKEAVNAVKEDEEVTIQEKASVYALSAVAIGKHYAIPLAAATASTICFASAHGLMGKRVAGLTGAYTALAQIFAVYRARVVDAYGLQTDQDFINGTVTEEQIEMVDDGSGSKKKVTKKVTKVIDKEAFIKHEYMRYFDKASTTSAKGNLDMDLFFLKMQQAYANARLKAQGYLFLNDVLESLGFPKTSVGQVVGWVDDSLRTDGFVDFGLDHFENSPMTVKGKQSLASIVLRFNVAGVMYDKIEKPIERYPEGNLMDSPAYVKELLRDGEL